MFQRDEEDKQNRLLVIQCDSGHLNGDLIACARYRVYDEQVNALNKKEIQNKDGVTHVLFIINLPHQVSSSSFVGFQGNPWISSHIDDLRPTSTDTIEPLHAIETNISELFIGEYIHDIVPLLDTTREQFPRQSSQSDSEMSLLDEEEATQEMPVHDTGEDADVEGEVAVDIGGHQMQPELTAVHDTDGEADVEDEGNESGDTGGYQVQTELQPVHDAGGEADIEDEAKDYTGGHQMQPKLQAESSSPEFLPTEQVLPEFSQQPSFPFECTAVGPHHQQVFQEQEDDESPTDLATAQTSENTKLDVTAYQENPAHFESVGDNGLQAGLSPLSHESEALPSVDESITPSQAVLPIDPEVPKITDMKTEGTSKQKIYSTPQESAKRQPPTSSGQCRRLYGCIQAAASRLEDSTKDRSTQRVTHLTKLIQSSPDHLSKLLIILIRAFRLFCYSICRSSQLSWYFGDAYLSTASRERG